MITESEKLEIIQEAKEEIIQYIKENLQINVDSEYDSYSGRRDHYHKVTISL